MGAALEEAVRTLASARVPLARREAEHLVAFVLGTDRGGAIARKPDPIPAEVTARLAFLLARRAAREPRQYLTGVQEFRGLEIRVDARVLVPRPETELVVDEALRHLPDDGLATDLGTGSGCIAVSIAVERPLASVHALDLSDDALALARDNAAAHGVANRIDLRTGDFAVPPDDWIGRMDVVVSNPPYVAEAEWRTLEPEVRDHEPKLALVAGPTGDEAYPPLARAASLLLRPGGRLVAELGHTNAPGARAAAEASGFEDVRILDDLRGIPRILSARTPRTGGAS